MRSFKFGFTLAEVLITIGIIGIVAAITIPTLITSYKKKQYYAQFMKARSVLENALRRYENDYESPFVTNPYPTEESVKNFISYFSGVQPVTVDNYENLLQGYDKLKIADSYDGSDRETGSEVGTFSGFPIERTHGFITNDGMFFMLQIDDGFGSGGFVDTNGPNVGPNTYGRDIFVFYLDKRMQKDMLCNNMWGQNSQCVHNEGYCYGENKEGFNCAARLIEEGKMDY